MIDHALLSNLCLTGNRNTIAVGDVVRLLSETSLCSRVVSSSVAALLCSRVVQQFRRCVVSG